MAEPTGLPKWDENDTNTIPISTELQDDGFALNSRPASGTFNSWFRNVYKWTEWFQEKFNLVDAELAELAPVDSISALRAIAYTPEDGQVITVTGFATAGDGGGDDFLWEPTNTDTDDNFTVKVTAITTGRFVRQTKVITPEKFGAFGGDSLVEDTPGFELMNTFCLANGYDIHIPEDKIFYLHNFISNVSITGTGTLWKFPAAAGSGVVVSLSGEDLRASDISVNGNFQHNGIAIAAGSHRSQLINVKVTDTQGSGLSCRGSNDCIIAFCTQTDANGQFGDGIYVDTSERTKVVFNDVYDVTRDGIVFETGCKDSTASHNTLRYGHDTTDGYNAGVWCERGTGAIITNNIIDDMSTHGIVTSTDGTLSTFDISGNVISNAPTMVLLGGSNLLTHQKVINNQFKSFTNGIICGGGNTIDLSQNHFGSATITDANNALIVYNNVLANQTAVLKISGNTKETTTYTADNSADIIFKAALNRILKLSIADMKGAWRINSGPINAIEEAVITNSDLTFTAVDTVNYTFPTVRSSLDMSDTQIILGSDMVFGKGLLVGKVSNCEVLGSGQLIIGDSSTANKIRFNNTTTADTIDIVAAYNSAGQEYWDGLFTIRKKIDCSVAATFQTVLAVAGFETFSFTAVKSQIRVDNNMAGITGDYLSFSLGSIIQLGSLNTPAAAGVFSANTKGAWTSWPGSTNSKVVGGITIYLASTLTNVDGDTIVGGGNFGGAAGDEVSVVIQGHRSDVLPNL